MVVEWSGAVDPVAEGIYTFCGFLPILLLTIGELTVELSLGLHIICQVHFETLSSHAKPEGLMPQIRCFGVSFSFCSQ